MVAAGDLKNSARIGEFAFLDVLNPGAVHAQGHQVLGLASNGAGVASDALAVIDDEAVFHRKGSGQERMRVWLCFAGFFTALAV